MIRDEVQKNVEELEVGLEDRLSTSNGFWRSCLEAARHSPDSLAHHMITRANIQLDPGSPLASLVPVGLLEELAQEMNLLKVKLGETQAERDSSKAIAASAGVTLLNERKSSDKRDQRFVALSSDERDQRFVALVHKLQTTIASLTGEVKSHIAARAMGEKINGLLAKKLEAKEYQVAKAREREAILGVSFVPLESRTSSPRPSLPLVGAQRSATSHAPPNLDCVDFGNPLQLVPLQGSVSQPKLAHQGHQRSRSLTPSSPWQLPGGHSPAGGFAQQGGVLSSRPATVHGGLRVSTPNESNSNSVCHSPMSPALTPSRAGLHSSGGPGGWNSGGFGQSNRLAGAPYLQQMGGTGAGAGAGTGASTHTGSSCRKSRSSMSPRSGANSPVQQAAFGRLNKADWGFSPPLPSPESRRKANPSSSLSNPSPTPTAPDPRPIATPDASPGRAQHGAEGGNSEEDEEDDAESLPRGWISSRGDELRTARGDHFSTGLG
eukprot:gene23490-17309_t